MGVMNLLFPAPIEFDLAVDAPPEEVLRVLSKNVSPRMALSSLWGFSGSPFIGSVCGTDFRIRKRVVRRNSFLPWIHGAIEPSESGGSIVLVDARIPAFTSIFTLIWLMMVAGFALLGAYAVTTGALFLFLAVPLILATFGYLFLRWGNRTRFPRDTDMAKGHLLEIFGPLGVREIKSSPPPSPRSA